MFTKIFKQISKHDVAMAGGKGASLGEMTRAKLPAPPGFVILAAAFERFLVEIDLTAEIAAALEKINYQDINSVDKASNIIRDLIHDKDMPADIKKEVLAEFKKMKVELVAVRSSATAEDSAVASWAGELETYLDTNERNLLANIKKCWSSLFTARAIFYRREKKLLKTKVSVAVVVQAMIQSEQEMMITRKARGGVKRAAVAKDRQERQKLSGRQIVALAKICLAIEKHYQKPQDIEWALANGKFYILQSRPITTL